MRNIAGIPREEYPRPQFVRKEWQNLNGQWKFAYDNGKSGRERKMSDNGQDKCYPLKITVPFSPESILSGIGNIDFMPCIWYRKTVKINKACIEGKRTILHFGACDHYTEVWINGHSAGRHIGGYVSFEFDITEHIKEGENIITVCAEDDICSNKQPSGKQCHEYASKGCMYTRTTGIWQTVWLEYVQKEYIRKTKYTAIIETSTLDIEAICESAHGMTINAKAFYRGKQVGTAKATVVGKFVKLSVKLKELHLWTPYEPCLYDLKLTLGKDRVSGYFGMRSIVYIDGKMLLNGRSIFERLVLDQGFYPDGIITAPTDAALIKDITMSKDMGFNGARMHQKIFEERYIYHCDRLGYMVWGEQGSWGLDASKPEAWKGFLPEWLEEIERDYNHPAIVGWCPYNESSKLQDHWLVKMTVDMTRAYDPTRPVIDASGWWHEGVSEITDTHEVERNEELLKDRYDKLAKGEGYEMFRSVKGNPSFISECGAMWIADASSPEWTKREGMPKNGDELLKQITGVLGTYLACPKLFGFCFTQLTDVEQEKNGLYTYDRVPKIAPERIKEVITRKAAIED